jgi:hypothetical protein
MFQSPTALRCRVLVSRDKAARVAVCLAPLLLAALGLAPAASAAERTTTFATAGAHSFVVPAGETSVRVELQGGAGGECNSTRSSSGARLAGTVPVFPGETLSIGVAGRGEACPIFDGAGGSGGQGGGGAGGSSPEISSTGAAPAEVGHRR